MMKGCYKPFLALISAVCCLLGAAGCRSLFSDDVIVNLRKSHGDKISISSIYDRIELVLLENTDTGSSAVPPLTNLSVTEDRFYFKCGDSAIVSYFKNGCFADTLSSGNVITDYSVYRDSILDVLSDKKILTYSLPDYSLKQRVNLVTPVNLTRIARRKDVIYIPGYNDSKAYFCEYDCETHQFANAPWRSVRPDVRKNAEQMSFLRLGNLLLSLYPDSGRIWQHAEFSFIFLDPVFKLKQNDYLEFLSAQVTDSKIFYSLLLNGGKYLLILNRKDRAVSYLLNDGKEHRFTEYGYGNKYLRIYTTREGLSLPLGVIRDGVNYVLCTGADLPRYVTRDVLDAQSAETMDKANNSNCNVVLMYYLAAP